MLSLYYFYFITTFIFVIELIIKGIFENHIIQPMLCFFVIAAIEKEPFNRIIFITMGILIINFANTTFGLTFLLTYLLIVYAIINKVTTLIDTSLVAVYFVCTLTVFCFKVLVFEHAGGYFPLYTFIEICSNIVLVLPLLKLSYRR